MSILKTADIEDFAGRVYVFVGIIMLFKVTFSLISYLVNPDAITDKNNGAGNIAKNIIITLFLIIFVPYGFDLLYNAQSAIVTDNLIPRLILGTTDASVDSQSLIIDANLCVDNDGNYITSEISDVGSYIALVTFKPFFQVYEDQVDDFPSETKKIICSETTNVKDLLAYRNIDTAILNTGRYRIDYSFFMSTAAGILVMLLLLDFCFDIAMRCIKLGFLEIFAPIPIVSYIDPKSGKDGMFKKWYREVFSTWARLFIRLIILFFVVYVISIVNNNIETVENSEHAMWIMLFLVIGALMFAKKAIPLIEDILGIKFDHSIELNPFKKIRDQAVGGKTLAALPGKTLTAGIGLATATGGAIAGQIGKRKKMNEAKNELDTETKNLERLKSEMRTKIANYKTAEAFEAANRPYGSSESAGLKKLRSEAIQAGYAVKSYQEEKVNPLQEKYDQAVETYKSDKLNKDGNLYFSAAHPIASTVIQGLQGAKVGFSSKDLNSISKMITEGINAAKAAATRTNNFDKFGYIDRLKDLGTDLTGVKNQSGTTSLVKTEIKEQTELLNDVRNMISSIEHQFGNLNPGVIVSKRNENKLEITVDSDFKASDPTNAAALEKQIARYEELRDMEKNITKSIEEYNKVLDINKK
jgi:hypothetical protein